jgi:aldose 1-epimerase
MTETTAPPSGTQYPFVLGEWAGVAVERGGGLRALTMAGRPVVDGYAADEPTPGAAGDILAPWPGRIEGARYEFGDRSHALDPTPGEHGAAHHGLVRARPWRLLGRTDASVRLSVELAEEAGYPFPLSLAVEWALTPDGLVATHEVRNLGHAPCPFALGAHPYLGGPTGRVDDLHLTLPAAEVLVPDAHGIPRRAAPVEELDLDFRAGAAIGSRPIDHTFGRLTTDPAGRGALQVRDPGGFTIELWWEAPFRHVHLFTSDSLDAPRRRRSLAVEPCTAPPNAFRSGRDLIVLAPGESRRMRWGIRVLARA